MKTLSIIRDADDATDENLEQDIVNLAKAHQVQEHVSRIGKWVNERHVRVMEDDDPNNVRLRIEDIYFAEPRDQFPSVTLMAKMALAIAVGKSERNRPASGPEDIGAEMGMAPIAMKHDAGDTHFGMLAHQPQSWVPQSWKSWAEASEIGYANAAKLTATVGRRRGAR